jgi:lysophospholipase L1-like esterase
VVRTFAAIATVTALLAACSSQEPAVPLESYEYVALGDSYTAAPFVPTPDGNDGCLRSTGNYPHLLAREEPRIDLTDVSCGGATTVHMTEPHTPLAASRPLPPQLDSVTQATDLVTLGIGGNDAGVFAQLLRCSAVAKDDVEGSPCKDSQRTPGGDRLLAAAPTVTANIVKVIDEIRQRAPGARVVVIGYPRLLPATGACPERVPLASGDVAYVARVNRSINAAVMAAADEAGVEAVDVFAASEGHDVCSDVPWVNSWTDPLPGAAPAHPFAIEQEAVAAMLLELLRDEAPA